MLLAYSSNAGRWGPEARKPGTEMSSRMLQQLGPAVVLHGVAYWSMNRAAFGVRLDGDAEAATMDVRRVPYDMSDFMADFRLLGVSPNGELSYISAGRTLRRYLIVAVEILRLQGIDDGDMSARWLVDGRGEEPSACPSSKYLGRRPSSCDGSERRVARWSSLLEKAATPAARSR